jgi:outer membrane protein OmpA-like peptidoglycan-associated protein
MAASAVRRQAGRRVARAHRRGSRRGADEAQRIQRGLAARARGQSSVVPQLVAGSAGKAGIELQRLAGNSAVAGLIDGWRAPRERPVTTPAVQRACCASCASGGSCENEEQEPAGPPVQRYASCITARVTTQDCPSRKKGEKETARNGPMVFLPQLTIPGEGKGVLIANFDIGRAVIKPNLHSTIYWQQFLTQLQGNQTRWRIVGFSDCAGKAALNTALRADRANAVQSILPAELKRRIDSAEGAAMHNCITENDTPGDRTLNRSVALLLTESTYDMPGQEIEGTITKPDGPSYDDCEKGDRELITKWDAMATVMAGKALAGLEQYRSDDADNRGSQLVSDLLVDSFGFQGSGPHLRAVILGFTRINERFQASDYQYECEDDCDGPHAYVYPYWSDVHMCMDALRTRGDFYGAGVAVHEMSHYATDTDDLEYFYYGSPATSSLHPDDAIGNADGYMSFASEFYKRG